MQAVPVGLSSPHQSQGGGGGGGQHNNTNNGNGNGNSAGQGGYPNTIPAHVQKDERLTRQYSRMRRKLDQKQPLTTSSSYTTNNNNSLQNNTNNSSSSSNGSSNAIRKGTCSQSSNREIIDYTKLHKQDVKLDFWLGNKKLLCS
jgi:hypothetical protein